MENQEETVDIEIEVEEAGPELEHVCAKGIGKVDQEDGTVRLGSPAHHVEAGGHDIGGASSLNEVVLDGQLEQVVGAFDVILR